MNRLGRIEQPGPQRIGDLRWQRGRAGAAVERVVAIPQDLPARAIRSHGSSDHHGSTASGDCIRALCRRRSTANDTARRRSDPVSSPPAQRRLCRWRQHERAHVDGYSSSARRLWLRGSSQASSASVVCMLRARVASARWPQRCGDRRTELKPAAGRDGAAWHASDGRARHRPPAATMMPEPSARA